MKKKYYNVTFAVSESVHKAMKKLGYINWSEVCRRAVREEIKVQKNIHRMYID